MSRTFFGLLLQEGEISSTILLIQATNLRTQIFRTKHLRTNILIRTTETNEFKTRRNCATCSLATKLCHAHEHGNAHQTHPAPPRRITPINIPNAKQIGCMTLLHAYPSNMRPTYVTDATSFAKPSRRNAKIGVKNGPSASPQKSFSCNMNRHQDMTTYLHSGRQAWKRKAQLAPRLKSHVILLFLQDLT